MKEKKFQIFSQNLNKIKKIKKKVRKKKSLILIKEKLLIEEEKVLLIEEEIMENFGIKNLNLKKGHLLEKDLKVQKKIIQEQILKKGI